MVINIIIFILVCVVIYAAHFLKQIINRMKTVWHKICVTDNKIIDYFRITSYESVLFLMSNLAWD